MYEIKPKVSPKAAISLSRISFDVSIIWWRTLELIEAEMALHCQGRRKGLKCLGLPFVIWGIICPLWLRRVNWSAKIWKCPGTPGSPGLAPDCNTMQCTNSLSITIKLHCGTINWFSFYCSPFNLIIWAWALSTGKFHGFHLIIELLSTRQIFIFISST